MHIKYQLELNTSKFWSWIIAVLSEKTQGFIDFPADSFLLKTHIWSF